MAGFTISPDQAREIERRRSTLRAQITAGANDRALLPGIVARLIALPAQGGDVTGAIRADGYMAAVRRFPAWAVSAACDRVLAGETDFGRPFAPTPVEFGDLVVGVLRPHLEVLADLDVLAKIEPEREASPEERKRVAEGFDTLKDETVARLDARKRTPAEQRQLDQAGLRKRLRDMGQPESALDDMVERII